MIRRLKYFCYVPCRWWLGYLIAPIFCWLMNVLSEHHYKGIKILSALAVQRNRKLFVDATCQALARIEIQDPRRFRALQREVKYIMCSTPRDFCVHYVRPWRVCRVNFSKYSFRLHPDESLRRYTCDLLHETIRGVLLSKKIPNAKSIRSRIEKICQIEVDRFCGSVTEQREPGKEPEIEP